MNISHANHFISFLLLGVLSPALSATSAADTIIFNDDFRGSALDPGKWTIPTWKYSGDGTFVGRTQFCVAQHCGLPRVYLSNVFLPIQTFNPTGQSFYGTELIAQPQFAVGQGIDVTVRARMSSSKSGGVVGGIFMYALKPDNPVGHSFHDEIDLELLTNRPNQFQTNIYANEDLGPGHPQFHTYASGAITDYHIYEFKWLPGQVTWFVDGKQVRTTAENIPAGPMRFYLTDWAPDSHWAEAYRSPPNWTTDQSRNIVLNNLIVDWVSIRSLSSGSGPVHD